jgi:hypothetical protein
MLDNDQKTVNAQNYGWFAGEAYWSRKFNMQFTDPTPNVRRRRAIPATTTERTVGEDEAPQANFHETSPTFSILPACWGGGSNPFTQGDTASAIDKFCSNEEFKDLMVVPKVSLGNGKTSSGQTKALDIKDFAKVGNSDYSMARHCVRRKQMQRHRIVQQGRLQHSAQNDSQRLRHWWRLSQVRRLDSVVR